MREKSQHTMIDSHQYLKITPEARVGTGRTRVQAKWYIWLLLLPVLCLVWGGNSYHRPEIVEKVERLIYDRHLGYLDEPEVDPEIVLVMVGEASLSELGQWPWPRSVHAGLLENLAQAHTVILDILFPETSRSEDDLALVFAAKRTKNLVLAMHLAAPAQDGAPKIIAPYPMLNRVSTSVGFTNMETDTDGLVRYCKPYREINGRTIPSLPLAAVYAIMGRPTPFKITSTGGIISSLDEVNVPVDTDGRLWINHGTSNATVYEYSKVINGEVPQEAFRNKIVLIGVSASGIEDYFKIPSRFGAREITGAQLNCNIIKSLLSQKTPHRVSPQIDGLLTIIMVLIGAALTLITRPTLKFASLGLLTVTLFIIHRHVFVSDLIYTALFLPSSGMIVAFSIFLFLKLKTIHLETEIKTLSISSIIGLPHDLGEKAKTYDDYLLSIWDRIQKTTGMQLLSPRTTLEKVSALALLQAGADMATSHDNVILAEDGNGPYKYLAMIPVASTHPAEERAYTLLGWQKRLSDSQVQAIVAVVLSTTWYFERLRQADEQKQLLLDTIHAISAAVDAKDPITGGHSNRVSTLALELAAHLNIDKKVKDDIYLGALIHDIGKIGIPDSILSKTGKLTDAEYGAIRKHPSVGKKIMASVKLPNTAMRAMYEHHERYNGKGYPLGLKGEQINLAGRIIAVADVFDALISDRPYRKAMPLNKALAYMEDNAGIEFDASIVRALLAVIASKGAPDTDDIRFAKAS